MNKVEVEVILIDKKFDYVICDYKQTKIKLIVDEDKVNEAKKFKLANLSNMERNSKLHTVRPSYVLKYVGSSRIESGDTSIGSWLYGVKPGTKRIKGFPANEFTREAYGIQ